MVNPCFVVSDLIIQSLESLLVVLLRLVLSERCCLKLFLECFDLVLEVFEFSVGVFQLKLQDIGNVLSLRRFLHHVHGRLSRVLGRGLQRSLEHEVELVVHVLCSQKIFWHESGVD